MHAGCMYVREAEEKIVKSKLAEGFIYTNHAVDEMIPWGQITFSADLQLLPAGDTRLLGHQ